MKDEIVKAISTNEEHGDNREIKERERMKWD